jgi:hypothetical protein
MSHRQGKKIQLNIKMVRMKKQLKAFMSSLVLNDKKQNSFNRKCNKVENDVKQSKALIQLYLLSLHLNLH